MSRHGGEPGAETVISERRDGSRGPEKAVPERRDGGQGPEIAGSECRDGNFGSEIAVSGRGDGTGGPVFAPSERREGGPWPENSASDARDSGFTPSKAVAERGEAKEGRPGRASPSRRRALSGGAPMGARGSPPSRRARARPTNGERRSPRFPPKPSPLPWGCGPFSPRCVPPRPRRPRRMRPLAPPGPMRGPSRCHSARVCPRCSTDGPSSAMGAEGGREMPRRFTAARRRKGEGMIR